MILLVISRKIGESFMIGDEIEVRILKIEGAEVKIGINAPLHVKIYRSEIYDKIVQENKIAAQVNVQNLKGVIPID